MLLLFLPPVLSFADETITGHYCYIYGDTESLTEARETCKTLALRNAIESYRIFVETTTKVTNFALTNDVVQLISAGYLKNTKVVNHTEKGRVICDTITAEVNPAEIEIALKRETSQRAKEIEDALDINKCLKIISARDTTCGDMNADHRCIRVVIKGVKQPQHCDRRFKRVFIDYFDNNGEPLDGASKEVPYKESGEIKAIEFSGDSLPREAKTFRVWLKHYLLLEE